MAQLSAPIADDVCASLVDGPINTCNINAVMKTFLSFVASNATNYPCNPAAQVEPLGQPRRLRDARPLPPADFADVAGVFRCEGATYAWM